MLRLARAGRPLLASSCSSDHLFGPRPVTLRDGMHARTVLGSSEREGLPAFWVELAHLVESLDKSATRIRKVPEKAFGRAIVLLVPLGQKAESGPMSR